MVEPVPKPMLQSLKYDLLSPYLKVDGPLIEKLGSYFP